MTMTNSMESDTTLILENKDDNDKSNDKENIDINNIDNNQQNEDLNKQICENNNVNKGLTPMKRVLRTPMHHSFKRTFLNKAKTVSNQLLHTRPFFFHFFFMFALMCGFLWCLLKSKNTRMSQKNINQNKDVPVTHKTPNVISNTLIPTSCDRKIFLNLLNEFDSDSDTMKELKKHFFL